MSDDMTCPSCGEGRPPRLRTELSKTSRRAFIEGLHPLATSEDWLEVQIRSGKDIDWACDTCLTSKRAIRLDGELTRGGRPAIATLERRKRCADCNAAFTVTAQEIVAGMRATFDPLFDQYKCSPCRRSSAVRDRASQAIQKIMDDPARRDCADYIELARADRQARCEARQGRGAELIARVGGMARSGAQVSQPVVWRCYLPAAAYPVSSTYPRPATSREPSPVPVTRTEPSQ